MAAGNRGHPRRFYATRRMPAIDGHRYGPGMSNSFWGGVVVTAAAFGPVFAALSWWAVRRTTDLARQVVDLEKQHRVWEDFVGRLLARSHPEQRGWVRNMLPPWSSHRYLNQ